MSDILKHLILSMYALLIVVYGSFAQHEAAGSYPFDFINIDGDAHSVGMGGARVAVPDGANGAFRNPASVSVNNSLNTYLAYTPVFPEMHLVSAAVSKAIKKFGVFAVSLESFSSGEIPAVLDNNGIPFYTNEVVGMWGYSGGLTWSYKIVDNFAAGITLRGLYEKMSSMEEGVDFYSTAVAIDAGVQYYFFRNRFCVGGVLKNVGEIVHQYPGHNLKLPSGVEVGVSYTPRNLHNVKLTSDISQMVGDYLNIRLGIEAFLYKEILAIRAGIPFSSEDLAHIGKQNYIKSNNNSLALGIGINPSIPNVKTKFSFALQFKTMGVPPVFMVSNTTAF
jgi:hypothetical protein